MIKAIILLREQKGKCFWCGDKIDLSIDGYLTRDHLVPKSKGGSNSKENLVASCRPCNQNFGDISIKDKINHLKSNNFIHA